MRLLQLGVAAVLLVAASALVDPPFYQSWWFWVGLTTALVTVLAEPNFTPPRAAVANAAMGVSFYFTATRTGFENVWNVYLATALALGLVALSVLGGESIRDMPVRGWITTRLGKARLFGVGALLIETLRVAAVSPRDAAVMFLVTVALLAVIALDWTRFLVSREKRSRLAVFEAAVSPNMLLFSSPGQLDPGQQVTVERGSHTLSGYVVGSLAHKLAGRYQIILNGNWRSVLPSAGAECTITPSTDQHSTLGFVVEGTDELSIRFQPLEEIEHGQAVLVDATDGQSLYQVTSLRLERDQWDNASGLQPRAIAGQIGKLSDHSISLRPWLPKPFQPVNRTTDLTAELPEGYSLIGHVSNTQLPIGVKASWHANDGHVGILGMSGMGKTTAARLVANAFDDTSLFVTIDGTGEYKGKLHWTVANPIDWNQTGRFVHEPTGQQAEKCEEIIKAAMTVANNEYESGDSKRRVLLLEEAHSFLPELNFVTSYGERDTVARSARYILQARKFGLSFVFVSQRTAVVSKSALSQCENFIILRTIDQTSLDFIESVVGSIFRDAVSGLRKFQALCVGPIFNTESPVIIDLLAPEGATTT